MAESRRSWGRIQPDARSWTRTPRAGGGAIDARVLDADDGPSLLGLRFAPEQALAAAHCPTDALMLALKGELELAGDGTLRAGELCAWRAGEGVPGLRAGREGAEVLLLALTGEAALHSEASASAARAAPRRVTPAAVPWQEFADAHGRPTEPVRVLFDGGPFVLGAKFRPTFSAGEHWHDWDTVYFVTAGEMQFGPQEPIYRAGEIRWVKGGHAYGPEQPGPDGVAFTLVSLGGPVNLRWADLEPAPHGRLA